MQIVTLGQHRDG